MEAARRNPLDCEWDRLALDAASLRSDGLTELGTNAYEYLLLLHAADEELKFGAVVPRVPTSGQDVVEARPALLRSLAAFHRNRSTSSRLSRAAAE
jgi:hypothetical protein